MVEGDPELLDTVTHETIEVTLNGRKQKRRIAVPFPLDPLPVIADKAPSEQLPVAITSDIYGTARPWDNHVSVPTIRRKVGINPPIVKQLTDKNIDPTGLSQGVCGSDRYTSRGCTLSRVARR